MNVLINLQIYKHSHWEATKNQSLDDICWPQNLQTLTLGDEFNQNIEGVQFPGSTPDVTPGSIVSGISSLRPLACPDFEVNR